MISAAFLDRDGIINRKAPEGAYITNWAEMEFLPGVASGIALLNRAGLQVIVVTNQRCVAKGMITAVQLDCLHERMCRELASLGATVDAVYYCPHEKQPPCACRKPAPGMLLLAALERRIDLAASWMIGDSDSDIAAGRAAGCKTARLWNAAHGPDVEADVVDNSLVGVVNRILNWEDGLLGQPTRCA
jgi:D-glycero-D-manno-heptose 1,7-bisphosphate phosphatase